MMIDKVVPIGLRAQAEELANSVIGVIDQVILVDLIGATLRSVAEEATREERRRCMAIAEKQYNHPPTFEDRVRTEAWTDAAAEIAEAIAGMEG